MNESPLLRECLRSQAYTTYPAGAVIFKAGESGVSMFGVRSGRVDLVVNGSVVETVEPGGVFGEMALIDHEPRSADAVARDESAIVPIDETRFLRMLDADRVIALDVMRLLAKRLRAMNQRVQG